MKAWHCIASVGERNPCADRLIAEYLEHAPPAAVEDAVETLAGPNLLRMVHTRHGAAAAVAVIAYGAPKDRKKAVKAFSGAVHAAYSLTGLTSRRRR